MMKGLFNFSSCELPFKYKRLSNYAGSLFSCNKIGGRQKILFISALICLKRNYFWFLIAFFWLFHLLFYYLSYYYFSLKFSYFLAERENIMQKQKNLFDSDSLVKKFFCFFSVVFLFLPLWKLLFFFVFFLSLKYLEIFDIFGAC